MRRKQILSYCVWNVVAHAQKTDFVLLRLKCDGTCAETIFRLTACEMWWHMRRNQILFYCFWNVMAHAQKPDFIFRAKWTSPFKSARGRQFSLLLAAEVCVSAVVMLDTSCSEVVWRVLDIHSIHQFPLHFPSRASPCAITFQLESNDAVQTILWVAEFENFHSNFCKRLLKQPQILLILLKCYGHKCVEGKKKRIRNTALLFYGGLRSARYGR